MQAALGHRNYLGGRRRAFDLGVAASVSLHALLLFGVAGAHESLRREALAPAPLTARLAVAESDRSARQATVGQKKHARPETRVAAPVQPEQAAAASAAEGHAVIAGAAVARGSEAAMPAPAVPPAAESDAAAPAESTQIATAHAPAGTPSAERAGPDTLASYRAAIFSAARRHMFYPRVALDNNWEGRAEVSMVFGADGALAALRLKASAGHAVLDAQAIEMLRKAALEARPPAALRGREFAVDVPVSFVLQEPSA